MAKPDLGTKRVCGECGAKFYDLDKNPIVCPKCGTPYEVVAPAVPTGRTKPQKAAEPKPAEDEEQDVADDANLVPLEDADAEEKDTGRAGADEEDADDDIPAMDDEVEEDNSGGNDEFLEEEEDDDVSGLIDNDIEDDRD